MFNWFKKKKKEENGIEDLSKDTLKAITKLQKKKFNNKKSIQELNKILRIYIENKFNFKKGLIVEELLKEIKSKKMNKEVKRDLPALIIEIYNEEYKKEEKTTKKKFNILIKEFKEIVKETN